MMAKLKKAASAASAKTDAVVDVKAAKKKAPKSVKEVGKAIGRTMGLGVVATWNKLLVDNADEKLTDVELMAAMNEEFPLRQYFQPVARIRSWFNAGRYGLGFGEDVKLAKDDPRRAHAYDDDGNVVKRPNPFEGKGKAKKLFQSKAEDAGAPKASKKVIKKVTK